MLYKAARVAILPETKSAQKVFSETGAKYYKDGKAVATAGATLAASYGDVSAATEATVTGGKVTNPDAATQVATVTASMVALLSITFVYGLREKMRLVGMQMQVRTL